jgi:hypothetical protein
MMTLPPTIVIFYITHGFTVEILRMLYAVNAIPNMLPTGYAGYVANPSTNLLGPEIYDLAIAGPIPLTAFLPILLRLFVPIFKSILLSL